MSKHQYIPAALKKAAIEAGATVKSGFIERPTPSGRSRRLSAVVVDHGDDRLVYQFQAGKRHLTLVESTKLDKDLPYWIRNQQPEGGQSVNDQLTSVVRHFLAA